MAKGNLMTNPKINKEEFVHFLKWCLPKLNLCWPGFRKVHGTVRKRLASRMRELGLPDLAAYRERLESEPSEWLALDRLCRIPISRFFRDKAVYEMLTLKILSDCAEVVQKRGGGTLRILSAGCASGEEPYTINLIWKLRLSERYPDIELQVFALDIDDVMLARAETACYSASSFRDMPADLFENGFYRSDGEYCLRDAFRLGVRFEKADLRETLPTGPFDLILCRNTAFTYFNDAARIMVFVGLDASLRDGGYLIIGSHESLPPQAHSYHRLQSGIPVYQKRAEADFTPPSVSEG
jgi:chemotaxis protein methyltransferase CheR